MKNALLFLTIFCSIPFLSEAQSWRDNTILFSGTVNYYPEFGRYSQSYSGSRSLQDLLLTFTTPTSGLFEVQEGDTINYDRLFEYDLSVPQLGAGFGVQWVNKNEFYQEIALTRLASSKSRNFQQLIYEDSTGQFIPWTDGFEQRNFVGALRYEYGKYFGDSRYSGLRFGISAGLESTFYAYRFTPLTSGGFPASANIATFELSVIPTFAARLSRRAFLDIKLIPNLLVADVGSFRSENPILTREQQKLSREDDSLQLDFAASLVLRYVFKERKRGKR